MPTGIPASFWRSGTSRCTLFRAVDLARYQPEVRENIILSALGAPPTGDRQLVDGLGGEIVKDGASLFKFIACITGAPGEGLADQKVFGHFPGPSWAENGHREELGCWDVVLRLARVKNWYEVEWPNETCHEVLAACAHDAIFTHREPMISASKILPYVQAARDARASQDSKSSGKVEAVNIPVRILFANTEEIFTVRVPINPLTMHVWEPLETWYDKYRVEASGRYYSPGSSRPAAIELELSLDTSKQLPTGNHIDTINVSGHPVQATILDVGLPVILVSEASLPQLDPPFEVGREVTAPIEISAASSPQLPSPDQEEGSDIEGNNELPDEVADDLPVKDEKNSAGYLCDADPCDLDNHPELHPLLDSIHNIVASSFPGLSSLPSAAVCIVGPMYFEGASVIGNGYICSCQADLCVRSVSVPGKFDKGLPELILTAITVAHGLKGSVVYETFIEAQKGKCGGGDVSSKRLEGEIVKASAAHPSGVAMADVKMRKEEIGRRAEAIIIPKTAREIMRGEVLIPERDMEFEPSDKPSSLWESDADTDESA